MSVFTGLVQKAVLFCFVLKPRRLAKAFELESDFETSIFRCGIVKILVNPSAYMRQRAKRYLKTALLGWFKFKCFGLVYHHDLACISSPKVDTASL